MAATRLFPGLAIRDAPRLLDTSEAWEKTEQTPCLFTSYHDVTLVLLMTGMGTKASAPSAPKTNMPSDFNGQHTLNQLIFMHVKICFYLIKAISGKTFFPDII